MFDKQPKWYQERFVEEALKQAHQQRIDRVRQQLGDKKPRLN